jgi:putative addiction module CopG family antidote
MAASVPPDVQRVIDARLATGKYATADDVLREAFRALQNEDVEVTAIQEAIDDWRQGDEGLPLDQAFDEIRKSIREGTSL